MKEPCIIHPHHLPAGYRHLPLTPATEGHSAVVYYLGKAYILKLLNPSDSLDAEMACYRALATLPVAQPLAYWRIEGREALLFPCIEGTHPIHPTKKQLAAIGRFLSQLHGISPDALPLAPRYAKQTLAGLIDRTDSPLLRYHFDKLTALTLDEESLIHGDLFRDNALFTGERLSAVIDWSDAARGDRRFDLAVVILDWCFQEVRLDLSRVDTLLEHYRPIQQLEEILPFVSYALLYYATTRILAGREDAQILLRRLEGLDV